MPRFSFQTKLFLAALSTALLALLVAGGLFAFTMQRQTNLRVEQTLRSEAQLAAELLARAPDASNDSDPARALDLEADRIGALITARVTFIGADGVVLGDSAEPYEAIGQMENHATRPEVIEARESGIGMSRRSSATIGEDMLYVAVPARHSSGRIRQGRPAADERPPADRRLSSRRRWPRSDSHFSAARPWPAFSRAGWASGSAPSRGSHSVTGRAISRRRDSTTATTNWVSSPGRSTIRCTNSGPESRTSNVTAAAWRPFSRA